MGKKKQVDKYIEERNKVWKDFKKVWLGGFVAISLIALFLAFVKNTAGLFLFIPWTILQIVWIIFAFYFYKEELKKIEYLKIDISKYIEDKQEQQKKELKQLLKNLKIK